MSLHVHICPNDPESIGPQDVPIWARQQFSMCHSNSTNEAHRPSSMGTLGRCRISSKPPLSFLLGAMGTPASPLPCLPSSLVLHSCSAAQARAVSIQVVKKETQAIESVLPEFGAQN
eukprot:scaffold211356_cov17-Tisochrysis_lutea.AAC.2